MGLNPLIGVLIRHRHIQKKEDMKAHGRKDEKRRKEKDGKQPPSLPQKKPTLPTS